jgi:hypothetical protein
MIAQVRADKACELRKLEMLARVREEIVALAAPVQG